MDRQITVASAGSTRSLQKIVATGFMPGVVKAG